MEQKTLQDKIFKYNVLLIFIPVFIFVTIVTVSIIFILSFIESESMHENASHVEEYFDSIDTNKSINIQITEDIVNNYEFSLQVSKNGEIILQDEEIPFMDTIIPKEDTSILVKMGYTIVSKIVYIGEDEYVLIASSYVGFKNISPSLAFRIIVWGIIIASSLVLIVIIHLTRKLTKSIKEPINIIIDGSNQVKEGNLEVKLNYEAAEYEEFIKVCDAFNEMVTKLKENIDATEKIYQDREVLIAGISHDLKTPLTAIKGYSKGLIDGVANTKEKQIKYLQTIYDKACVMEDLFNQLMLVSDLQTQTIHLNKLSVLAKNSLDRIFEDIKTDYESKMKINYTNSCNDEKWLIDESQFARVIVNLFENSYKYCNKEDVVINVNCYVENNNIIIEYKDNGPGVAEDKINKIFDLFYRADEARTSPHKGSGIGLAITKQIVELLNGNVTAENEGGLKIIISIPKEG